METLRELGLSSYEERSYRALLALGSATASDVVEKSGVPTGRIYDSLGGLESRGLVRVHTIEKPKRYVPVEPETAVSRLIESRKSELSAEINRLEANQSTLVDSLSSIDRPRDDFWTAAVGPDDSLELLFERLDTAEESVVLTAAGVSEQFDVDSEGTVLLDWLLDAIDDGINVSVLLSPPVYADAVSAVDTEKAAFTIAKTPFELRVTDAVYGNFYLIDRAEVCLEVPDPIQPNHLFGMLNLRTPRFSARVAEGFESIWAAAEPIESIE